MSRKRMRISIILIMLIGFGCIIMFNKYLKKSGSPTSYPIKEEELTGTVKENYYGTEEDFIQLDYPDGISYPGIKQFDISVSKYPFHAAYCKISADFGDTSVSKISLKKENQIRYYLPDNFDSYMYDSILLEFYDECSKLIGSSKIAVQYNMDEKLVQIFEIRAGKYSI